MTDLLLRFGLVIAIVAAAFLAASITQRRAGTSKRLDLPPGLVVVTGPECRWCDRLLNALAQRTGISYRVLEHSQAAARGIVVRSRSFIGNIGASLQTIVGGNITVYTTLCERARSDAFQLMLTHAGEVGANAVIGVRYDATEIGAGVTEVLCYGTAVFVEPVT